MPASALMRAPAVWLANGTSSLPQVSRAVFAAVVTPGPDNVYRSANVGQSWTTYAVPGTGGGVMLNSLEFMSQTVGCLVTGNPGIGGQLLRTANAGRTWYPVRS